jgi:glutamate-1-semialdehyde 2,1-aminomutase
MGRFAYVGQSDFLWVRYSKYLAGGPATLSKHPKRYAPVVTPKVLSRADGAYIYDCDDKPYIDTVGGLGAVLMGHSHPEITKAITTQASRGLAFPLMHKLEAKVADIIVNTIPSAESVRFCKNGSEATSRAVRLARHVTNKRHVLCSGYHGSEDWYISSTNRNGGILPIVGHFTHQFAWGDEDHLRKLCETVGNDLACIIVEVPPRPLNEGLETASNFLKTLRRLALRYGALFVVDEVVTGFRYGLAGACGLHEATADLVCIGKAMANGVPIAALCGRRDIMSCFEDGGVFMSTTGGGDPLALAATRATIHELKKPGILESFKIIGNAALHGISALVDKYKLPATVIGNHSRFVIQWHTDNTMNDVEWRTVWLQETVKRGVLFGGPTFPQTIWDASIVKKILEVADESMLTMSKEGKKLLKHGTIAGDAFNNRFQKKQGEDV